MFARIAIASAVLFVTGSVVVSPLHAADIEAGKAKAAAVCAACHGANGVSVAAHIPNLAGQKAGYIGAQLRAFKSAARKNDVMNAIAAQLNADEIGNVAAHFAAQIGATGDATSSFMPSLARTNVAFPANFPNGFTRYQTSQNAERKTISSFYANDKALAAARAGQPLPEGSVIIGEAQTAKLDADMKPVLGSDGKFVPDKVTGYTSMGHGADWGKEIPDMLRNGNWNYGAYTAAREVRPNVNYAECFACHKPKESSSYLFTLATMAAKP